MEKLDIDISLKNIGSVSWNIYEKICVDSIEDLIYRMRWKYYHFKKDKRRKNAQNIVMDNQTQFNYVDSSDQQEEFNNEFYGLKTNIQAPFDKDLKPWEDDMVDMISNLKKRNYRSAFQDKIRHIEVILRNSDKILISSDKTDNHYFIEKNEYIKNLRNCITKDYRKSDFEEIEQADIEAASLAKKLGIEWRLEKTALKPAFITVKDHKEDWPARASFRLINPMKANIGKVSKKILERINKELRASFSLNQLISTQEVINWFENTDNKERKSFFQCDIENFYPSISEDLLRKALDWAKTQTYISDLAIDIIFCARRNVLYDGEQIWVKKKNAKFDIGMGAFDGAECSELIGIYMLHTLIFVEKVFKREEVCLYRDDMLSMVEGDGPTMDRIRKAVVRIFKKVGLSVKCETNLKKVMFLDVLFDLDNISYKPYHKPNSKIMYVSRGSNHPKVVLDNIPKGINQRLSSISSDQNAFNSEVNHFQQALSKAGHNFQLSFYNNEKRKRLGNVKYSTRAQNIEKHRNRENVIWFNPPYNIYSATNIGRIFRDLIDKHFSSGNDASKLFNKNKLKISYKCLPNLKSKISAHNKHILSKREDITNLGGCNCQKRLECPLNGNCLVSDTVYRAEVLKEGESVGSGHQYVGMASGEFKICHRNHTKSFRLDKYENETELSKFVWQLKRKNINFKVNFEILSHEKPYQRDTGKCAMCSKEKIEIVRNIKTNRAKSLNRRWEIYRKCLHRGNHLLGTINTRHRDHIVDFGRGDRGEENNHLNIPSGQTRSGRQWRENT